jgi:hypothetical protein
MVNIELAHETRRGIAIVDAELAAGAIAIGIHRSLRHAQFAGDLLRRQMLVHKAQALTLSGGKQADRIDGRCGACGHHEHN